MEIFRIVTLAFSGVFFLYLSVKEEQKGIQIALAMIAAYLLFEGVKRLIKLLKQT